MTWLRPASLGLAIVGAVLLLSSALGTRYGLWSWKVGLPLFGAAGLIGVAAALAALVGLAVPRVRRGSAAVLAGALAAGVGVAWVPVVGMAQARSLPPIHDITTDPERPPEFSALLALRAGADNPPGYAREAAALQRAAYPDIQPLQLAEPPQAVAEKARQAAEAMGWELVAFDRTTGRLEAVATTLWFGFKDDVVVRVTPAGQGSRVDVRSKSRVGRGDGGANARRIRTFLQRLK